MQKILYIITKGNWGGAQRYVYDLATRLPKEKYEIAVAYGEGTLLKKKLTSAGVRTIKLARLKETRRAWLQTGDAAACLELLRLFKNERPDIIHFNSSRAAFLGVLAANLYNLFLKLSTFNFQLKTRTVFTVHGWPFKEPRSFFSKAGIWIASYATTLLANRTIVLSTKDKALGEKMPGIARKLSLIYNGIEETAVLSREDAWKKLSCEDASHGLWLGTIAELNKNKGIVYLIEAMAQLPKTVRLCVIGEGEERTRLEMLSRKLEIANRVFFTGFKEDAAQYLKAFDIFVLPSLKEGLPYSIMEAGLQRIPVVGTDISGIRDIIIDKQNGFLVPPHSPTALAEAIRTLIENQAMRNTLSDTLKQNIREHFTFHKMLANTNALYRI